MSDESEEQQAVWPSKKVQKRKNIVELTNEMFVILV